MDNILLIAQYFILPWAVFVIGAGACATVAVVTAAAVHHHASHSHD